MNLRAVSRVLGFLAAAIGTSILPSVILAIVQGTSDALPLALSAALPLILGVATLLATRGGHVDLGIKDGFAIVTFGWILAAFFGALPYFFSGICPNLVDAFFESMSGFTTTGSTILTEVESIPPATLLWRSVTQWLGGMGIIVLSVAILPILGIGGMQLYKAEVPGPTNDRLTPRIQSAAKTLWGVYFLITVAEIAFLMLGRMSLFDSICHTFTTVSTGGFSTRNASVAAFGSGYIETVVIVFMFLSGVNFSLHLWVTGRRMPSYWKSEEFRLYTIVVLLSTAVVAASLVLRNGMAPLETIRPAAFQVVSILTTTGFGTADYLKWGFGVQTLLFLLMFLGASAGSTAGGLKMMRIGVLAKYALKTAKQEIHPRAIFKLRYSGSVVPDDVMLRILGFFLLYMAIFFVFALAVTFMGVDFTTSMGATIATLSNIGPGLGGVGPASNFAGMPLAAKALLSFGMLLGRLELYTVLVVMTPTFWKRT